MTSVVRRHVTVTSESLLGGPKKRLEGPLRVMSVEEQAAVERAWDLSPECARLQERQAQLKERIGEKSSVYSNRC